MCESCVREITKGHHPPMTPDMWRLAGLAWDWYRMPGNGVGGVLHIVLDDYNVDDRSLDFCMNDSRHWSFDEGGDRATMLAARDKIVAGLRLLSEPERVMVVRSADPYGPVRPWVD